MREEVVKRIEQEKIIVIVRGVESEKLVPLAEAIYEGGIRLLEITYSADGRISDEETADNINRLSEHFGDRLYIGAGTVLTEKQVELAGKAGGKFILSPDTCPEVIKKTGELGMVSVPGALTPSEIQLAHKSGADFVKVFPINHVGVDYVKTVLAPLSHIKLIAVGSIQIEDMKAYLAAGACGFAIGAGILDKTLLAAEDYHGITELTRQFVKTIR